MCFDKQAFLVLVNLQSAIPIVEMVAGVNPASKLNDSGWVAKYAIDLDAITSIEDKKVGLNIN
jgi:purine nucleoside permease